MNMLEGTLPQELGTNMPQLLSLNIYDNNLHGALPSSLYNLSSLRNFDVADNNFHGRISADIGEKFPQLRYFLLSNNSFSGEIPSSLSNLTNHTLLVLSENGFSGLVPRDLGKLNALQYLLLGENMLEAGDTQGWGFITSLANCSQLQILLLGRNNFTGQFPISIANLSRTLQILDLNDNRISGSIP
ncbi:hypothetical protein GUJ93_ZPchr0008g11444 [Zizania palustris]|uniref:Uncharacterized protein n=1 Tax=Zizania palustris TaxID=103762 RepID=A0A8J5V172_ZIZPA|nr:hypothetical protein GUJ93_ZPchr0008g11444 [Zizania palustris]